LRIYEDKQSYPRKYKDKQGYLYLSMGSGFQMVRLSTEIVRVSRTEDSRLKVILSLPCGNLEEILKNYPRLYNQLNPCSRALQSVKTLRTRRTRTCGPGAPKPGRGPGTAAGGVVFKFLPNASNRLPLNVEILRNGLNVL